MSKDYDCRMYCLNLKQVPFKDKPEGRTQGYFKDTLGYYCALTDKICIAAKEGIAAWSDNKLDIEVVERCPGRKTLDDVVKTPNI